MFDKILAVLHLGKEIPDAVGYHTAGPIGFTLPSYLLNKIPPDIVEDFNDIEISYLFIDNFTNKTLNEVRVVYSGDIGITPDIHYANRKSTVEFIHDEENSQIFIKEILPEESIVVSITNAGNNFAVDKVLIEGSLVTSTMKMLAAAKRSPSLVWLSSLALLLFTLAIFSSVTLHYKFKQNELISESVNVFYKKMGYGSCQPELFKNDLYKEKELVRLFNQLSEADQYNTLKLNDVESFEKLKHKENVIFCKFEKIP